MSSHGTAPLVPQHVIPNRALKYGEELHKTALALGASGKGLLAADESTGSIAKRLEGVGKENTEDNRREWRDVLFTTEGCYEDYVAGVITFEETLMKHDSQLEGSKYKGKSFVEILTSRGVVPGIKVDKGTIALPRTSPEETTTQGLDGLLERSQQYYKRGARFSKWRATYTVSESTPTAQAIEANAEALARYAAVSQQAGLVPIVEPEVLMSGDFTIQRSMEAHIAAYSVLFAKLALHKVDLAGLVLKASMVVCGDKKGKATPEEVGEATIHVLSKTVPPLVPTIVFLLGGFSDSDILSYLNSINKVKQANPNRAPWALTFSFGRALQGVAMKAWAKGDVKDAQAKWVDRAKWGSAASLGKYNGECPS